MTALDPTAYRLVIVGAGGFGREVLDVVEAADRVDHRARTVAFVDDGDPDLDLLTTRGTPLLGGIDDMPDDAREYVIGVGDPRARRAISERMEERGFAAVTVAHPSATFGAAVTVGPGSVICAHASLTTNITVGRHVHLNPSGTVGHDCTIDDFVTVCPGANVSGNVHLEEGVWVGTGSAIIQGVRVGAGTTIGAGSVVTRDLPAGVVAFGSPARAVRDVG